MSMVFSDDPQKSGQRNFTGLAVIAGLHVVLGYALINGLGHVVVDIINPPADVTILPVAPPPPPPPPPQVPQPRPTQPPQQVYAPTPEIPVAQQNNAPVITTTPEPQPVEPLMQAPAPSPVQAPPAPPRVAARPAIANVNACAPTASDYPAAATRAEATGTTRVRFTINGAGKMTAAEVVKSAGPSREHRLLDRVAVDKLSACVFKPGVDENGQPAGGTFDVDYVWKLE